MCCDALRFVEQCRDLGEDPEHAPLSDRLLWGQELVTHSSAVPDRVSNLSRKVVARTLPTWYRARSTSVQLSHLHSPTQRKGTPMVSADKKASTTKVDGQPKAKALPSIKQLEERIARRNTQNAEDQALLDQLIAKRDEKKVTKLSSIEEQIAKLKAQAAELGIAGQVDFLGQVPDARRYFQAFDVFALSSDHEPFGMVLLEAMVAGVPVLATACGGAREVVEGVGVLFPLGDAAQLAQGLKHLAVLDGEQRQACAEHMLQRLRERFSDHAVREAFWQLPQVRALVEQA